MPVEWSIDSRTQVVVVTAEGKVTRAEMEAYLEAVTGAGANGYAKIFDATNGEAAMTSEDMTFFAATFRRMHGEPHGPLAIVLQKERQQASILFTELSLGGILIRRLYMFSRLWCCAPTPWGTPTAMTLSMHTRRLS